MATAAFLPATAGAGDLKDADAWKKGRAIPRPCKPVKWRKKGVVLRPEEVIKGKFIQNFNSPAVPLGNGKWRIWFSAIPEKPQTFNIGYAEGVPGQQMDVQLAQLSEGTPGPGGLSIGNLPAGWNPVQPVYIQLKNGRHRLYFWAHGKGVVRFLAAESENGQHYTVLTPHEPCLYHPNDRAVTFTGVTASGQKVTAKSDTFKRNNPKPAHEKDAPEHLICNDATTVYQLADGTFELYTVTLMGLEPGDPRWARNDNLAGFIRVIDRMVSKDGIHFTGRSRVLAPDGNDPEDLQFYNLNVTYTDKGRVGMLGHFRCKDQTMDIEWCYSRDGIHWERPCRNLPWIARGWPGADQDSLCLYPATGLVPFEGRWYLFYTGCNYTHNHKVTDGDATSMIHLAETASIWDV
ncbi:hypothetical protein DLD77_00770 [Chitinophaga alhagiae]|uniref:Uncharacterized protein n=1 Tax=Chitinophaga alhagiae TaxID=2203219 RepID=A0ABN5LU99_9BACT|nr:hypothetical protein DLD77_00770 [Chitinophaga alhagiae]